jgi:hypothetical protein
VGDLLERVLDKGVIVKLDLIISVAGIPLVGLSLHAAVASIETMNRYGMFGDWDRSSRAEAAIERAPGPAGLGTSEKVLLEQFAMVRSTEGIMAIWQPGRAYVTDQRLVLVRNNPFETLVSLDLADITGIGSSEHTESGVTSEVVCLADAQGGLVLIRAREPALFRSFLTDLLRRHEIDVVDLDPAQLRAAFPDVSAESQLWHESEGEGGWRPGWGAIREGTFTFWSDFERRDVVRVPLADVARVGVERRQLRAPLGERDVLVLTRNQDERELVFAGKDVEQWSTTIQRVVASDGKVGT